MNFLSFLWLWLSWNILQVSSFSFAKIVFLISQGQTETCGARKGIMKSHLFWWPLNFSIVDYYRSQRSALDANTRNCRTKRYRWNNLEAQSLPGTLWNRAVQKSPAVRSYGERERSTRVVTGPVVFNKGQSFRGPKVHSWLATGCRPAGRPTASSTFLASRQIRQCPF